MSEAPELPPELQEALKQGREFLDSVQEASTAFAKNLQRTTEERDKARRDHATAQGGLAAAEERIKAAAEEATRLLSELEQARAAEAARERELGELVARHEAQLGTVREELSETRRDRDGLQAFQIQWGIEREQLMRRLDAADGELTALKARHAEMVEHSNRLAADWAARRQALAAEIHAQNQEMEQVRRALKEGDGPSAARPVAPTVTTGLAHELGSRLNAVVGFSSVLAEDRAGGITPEERREFVRNLHDSALRLADAIRQLTGPRPAVDVSAVRPGRETSRKAPDILVADAEPAVRERIEPFLKRAGYDVIFVTTAAEALEKATALQPLAILIDAQLPPDGAGPLVRELRRDRRAREIPLVLMVADGQPEPPMVGDYESLAKPVDRQQLVQMMVKFDLIADGRKAKKMPPNVLLIDDDPQVASLLKAILKPFNVRLSIAENAKAGIEQALRHPPDLVVLDLVMPGQDGFEVIAALRRDSTLNSVPILIQTAKQLTDEDRRRLQGQVQSVIEKGAFQPERLLELLLKRGERRGRSAEQRPAA